MLQRIARCTQPLNFILTVFSSYSQNTQSLIQGFVKDSKGTFEGIALQKHWEVLNLIENCRILLLTFRRFHFEC